MATVGEADDLRRHLRDEVMPKQRVKASDVGTRINCRQDVFGLHSLGWTVPPVCLAMDDGAPHQTTKFGIPRMERGLSRVCKFRHGKNHLAVLGSLISEKGLPFQSFHGGQTFRIRFRAESRTALPPPPEFICWATVGSICWSMTF